MDEDDQGTFCRAGLPVVCGVAGRAEGAGDQGGSFSRYSASLGGGLFRGFEFGISHRPIVHGIQRRANCRCHPLRVELFMVQGQSLKGELNGVIS